jgi:hypothetical protein
VRQPVDQIAAKLAADQEQMTRDINKLQAAEQEILDEISAPRPAAAPAHKPTSLTPLTLPPPEAQLVRGRVRHSRGRADGLGDIE